MKNMKVLLTLVVSAFLMMGIVACTPSETPAPSVNNEGTLESTATNDATETEANETNEETEQAEAPVAADGKIFNVGIIQLTDHPALAAAQDGFIAAFEHYGVNASFDIQNALGDRDVLATIADRHVGNNVDLVLAIATPSVQTMFAASNTIPIVGSAITSYETAGAVENNEATVYNVTGASDMNPIPQQIDMIFEFVPHLETLGIAYASSEPNAVYQAGIAKDYAESIGLTVITSTVTSVGEVQQNIAALATNVDAIWIPTDNTHADAMPIVGQVAIETGVPAFAGEDQMTMGGGLATLSINYFELGFESGRMARDILVHGANPAEMPIRFGMDLNLNYIVNGFMAQEMGIEIPERFADYVWFPEE